MEYGRAKHIIKAMYHALPGTFSDEEIREARLLLGIIVEEEL